MFRNRSVQAHHFSMTPRAEIPRSTFVMDKIYKTTFDGGYLIPVYLEEVLPGDTFQVRMTAFARLATPLQPFMDNLHLDSFFFYCPKRLLWNNFVKFMGEQANPGDSISFTIPQQVCPAGGYAVNSLQDYFGLPTVGQVGGGNTVTHNALPLRMHNRVWNEWFRDENLQNSVTVDLGDGPDAVGSYVLLRRGKRHDYITSCLPWPQKGATPVSLPLGTSAPVTGTPVVDTVRHASDAAIGGLKIHGTADAQGNFGLYTAEDPGAGALPAEITGTILNGIADLSAATAATINQIRQAFQIQRLLERDARGGTRYTELVRSHFGVISPDQRLQRSEYLGGGTSPVVVSPIAQTSATGLTGGSAPVGTLTGMGTAVASGHGFTQSFTEHGYILGLVSVRADLTYQQGLRKLWSRLTRYDFYWPAFANLGEQAVLNKEVYCDGSANDALVFGYQERWAEYRYSPSQITGLFKSTSAGTIDSWHAAQRFTGLPTLGATFIQETPPIDRIVAVGAAANGKQFLFDALFTQKVTRAMPLYSVPGMIDHF